MNVVNEARAGESWAAFRSETPTNNQPLMRKAFHAGWGARDAEIADLTAQLQAAQATVASVRELGGAILRESHCGYLGRDILTLIGDADTTAFDAAVLATKAGAWDEGVNAAVNAVSDEQGTVSYFAPHNPYRASTIEQTEGKR